MRVAFIGGGNMAEAIIKGLLAKGITKAKEITVTDIKPARLKHLAAQYKVTTSGKPEDTLAGADLVVLAFKPQDLADSAAAIKHHLPGEATVISILAGTTLSGLRIALEHPVLVRTIPNMPAQIGEGITVWAATKDVTLAQRESVRSLLSALGKEIFVTNEEHVDMATALSSSGPAYVFLIIEALTDAGVHIGLPRAVAQELVLETIVGSAHAVEVLGKHPAELKNMVTSPAGTTTEALRKLEAGGLRHLLIEAVEAAYEKSRKLGKR
jgi:pyrroline-5-carboxylate reductase